MRRLASGVAALVGAIVLLVVLGGASSGAGDPYDVRAIFENASFVAQGEEVRVAGAPVGSVVGLGVTASRRAAVTLEIDNATFTPFHADASCAIRVQSLIGEKYVDCTPGSSNRPKLARITTGPGKGNFLLPVARTTSPVDFDIVQDIYREPVREQFALILNELGTGLAARGADLNAVIRRANPALAYTDQVFKILAAQNRQLAQLATDSNTVLTPLVAVRRRLADFVAQADRTATASAARAHDLARSFQLLPRFLRRLRPLMTDLGSLADQATPVFSALSQAAPAINRQYQELGPFAIRARRALIELGNSAVQQQPALLATVPLARRLQRPGSAIDPTAASLAKLTTSFQQTGGIEQLMALLFYGTSATNGFDADGHYVRTDVLVGGCTAYAKVPVPGCSANFGHTKASAQSATTAAVNPRKRGTPLAGLIRAARTPASPSATSPALLPLLHYLVGNGP